MKPEPWHRIQENISEEDEPRRPQSNWRQEGHGRDSHKFAMLASLRASGRAKAQPPETSHYHWLELTFDLQT